MCPVQSVTYVSDRSIYNKQLKLVTSSFWHQIWVLKGAENQVSDHGLESSCLSRPPLFSDGRE